MKITKEQIELTIKTNTYKMGIIDKHLCLYNLTSIINNDNNNAGELEDRLYDYINGIDIIGHYDSIKFLMDNDPSLRESLNLAEEFGYIIEGVSSELLASLLLQSRLKEAVFTELLPKLGINP